LESGLKKVSPKDNFRGNSVEVKKEGGRRQAGRRRRRGRRRRSLDVKKKK